MGLDQKFKFQIGMTILMALVRNFHVDWWRCLQVKGCLISEKLLYMRVESQYVSVRVKGKASRSREPLMTRTVEEKEAYVRCWQLR